MNKSESKYFATAARMDEAFLELIEKKDFAYITVKEICEKAGVNRSTFYLHYETVGDLLVESVQHIIDEFVTYMPQDTIEFLEKLQGCPLEELYLITPEYLTPYLTYIKEHRRIFKTTVEQASALRMTDAYQKLNCHVFIPILNRFGVPSEDQKYVIQFHINGLMAIIDEWLKEDCKDSIEHIISVMQRCIIGYQQTDNFHFIKLNNTYIAAWFSNERRRNALQLFYGVPEDIEKWMSLVTQVRRNFPGLETQEKLNEHRAAVLKFMSKRQAICVKEENEIVGVLLFSRGHNMICCLAVAPEHRRRGVASMLMDEALGNLDRTKEISVSTFRANDEKGPAPRALYEKYGFVAGELIEELDYPNQKFVLHPIGAERKSRQLSMNRMVQEISNILADCDPTIYLYGSSALDDFKLGWSDIDILVLTEKQISESQATLLVGLRQAMLVKEPDNPYYRSFEGGMLTRSAFLANTTDRVVYWGTSGERITDRYWFDSFGMTELIESSSLLHGKDIRKGLKHPAFHDLYADVNRHYETIRKYAQNTGRNYYAFGWLLDIARCIYTLRTGRIIAKTKAAEWALQNDLCPDVHALTTALNVRRSPLKYQDDKEIFDYAETLGEPVQRFADVLEKELKAIKSDAEKNE